MHNQKAANPHGQTRIPRIVHRRPAVKAAAEVFIQSLVLAGFCSDHAPKKYSKLVHTVTPNRSCVPVACPAPYYSGGCINQLALGSRHLSISARVSKHHPKSLSTYAASNDHDDRGYPAPNDFAFMNTKSVPITISKKERIDKPGASTTEGAIVKYKLMKEERTMMWEARLQERLAMKMYLVNAFTARQRNSRMSARRTGKVMDGSTADLRSLNFAVARDLESFLEALWDHSKSNQYIFTLYKRLPSPGVKHLTAKERGELLYRFAHPPDRRRSNARHYLTIFEDMIESGFTLSRSMCTSAIYFTSHKVPVLERRDLKDAIAIWHRMENVYGIQSDNVVFELLLRIASITGHFEVADRLLIEMTSRGLSLSREGYMTKLYSYGKRGDVNGIHQTFGEFVNSGAIVDTAVLNCLIASLLNAGDSDTAEKLYSRMMRDYRRTLTITPSERLKTLFSPSMSPDFTIWRPNAKWLAGIFNFHLKRSEQYSVLGQHLQDLVPIVPDPRTIHILLRYHCTHTGNLTAVGRLLREAEQMFEVPPRSIIYYFLFRGFAINPPSKGWTNERLLEVWGAFKRALYESYTRVGRLETDNKLLPMWENPLESIYTEDELFLEGSHSRETGPDHSVDNLTPETQDLSADEIQDHQVPKTDTTTDDEIIMELFDNVAQFGKSNNTWYPDENLLRRIDNGIFLSRELNIVILKAFGAHCGTSTLLRIYSDIERMWKPWKRLGVDVQSVKKELRRQLSKARKRELEQDATEKTRGTVH